MEKKSRDKRKGSSSGRNGVRRHNLKARSPDNYCYYEAIYKARNKRNKKLNDSEQEEYSYEVEMTIYVFSTSP